MTKEETSETSFDDEFDGFNNNKFNKRKMSDESYNGNLRNYFRIQRNNEMMENHVLNNNFVVEDEEIIFTENKIYIGSNESNLNSMILNKVQKQSLNILRNDNHINLSSCLKENEKLCGKNHFDPESIHNYEEVIFEKVKYDRNKKYLIESPSTSSSIGKMSSIMNFDTNSTSINFDNLSNRPISEYDNVPWIFQNHGNYDNLLYHLNKSPNFKKCDHPLCGITKTSPIRIDENLNNSINNENPWNMLENHRNSLDKNSEQEKEKWWWFNRRGSSSTLETWIDDESYDNSFNEELEKRCSGFER